MILGGAIIDLSIKGTIHSFLPFWEREMAPTQKVQRVTKRTEWDSDCWPTVLVCDQLEKYNSDCYPKFAVLDPVRFFKNGRTSEN